jgi:hypothetical protein
MGFFSGLWSWFTGSSITSNLVKTAMLGYASRLINDSIQSDQAQATTTQPDTGVRLQMNPSTDNKIPVLYGEAYFGGHISDAYLSSNYQKMTYVLTLAETTGNKINGSASAYTFNGVYFNNNRVVFKSDGITVDYTLDSSGNQDISARDLIKVYFYANGTGIQPTGSNGTTPASYSVVPNWTQSTHPMTGLVYAVVEVTYNRSKNISGLPDCTFHVTNNTTLPGDVLNDYMKSTRYGAGISASEIDSSLTALNTFANAGFTYKDANQVVRSGQIAINGLIDTSQSVLSNMETIATAASSWISYDIHQGKWTVVINKASASVASINDSNIIDEISISGTNLTQLSNIADVKYQNTDILDKSDFVKITIPNNDLFQNEPRTTAQLSLPLTNKQAVAMKLGLQLLKQARIDKIVSFKTDYSYINLRAGDVIDLTSSVYGFTNKLFRIITVEEIENDNGYLEVDFKCLEYDATVYDYDITEYFIETDDGILGIGSIGKPDVPTVTKFQTANVPKLVIDAKVPSGIVDQMEYWITFDTNVQNDTDRTYIKIGTFSNTNGSILSENQIVSYTYSQLGQSNFFVKVRGINNLVTGPYSDPTGLIAYVPTVVADTVSDNPVNFGGQLMSLGLLSLLNLLDELFDGDDSKSLVEKLIDEFFPGNDGTTTDIKDILTNDSEFIDAVGQQTTDFSNYSINSLNDVDTETNVKALGDMLVWDGTNWINVPSCCELPEPPQPPEPCYLNLLFCPTNRSTTASATGKYQIKAMGNYYSPLVKGTGNIKLYKSNGQLIETKTANDLTIDRNVANIQFSTRTYGTDYYILMDKGVIKLGDCINEAIVCPDIWSFKTPSNIRGVSECQLVGDDPLPIDPLTIISSNIRGEICPNTVMTLKFNSSIKKGTGNVYIRNLATNTLVSTINVSNATVNNNTLSISNVLGMVSPNESYYITADAGIAIKTVQNTNVPSDAIPSNNQYFSFSTFGPLQYLNYQLTSAYKDPNIDTNIILYFNKAIQAGVGSFYIRKANGTLHEQINMSGSFETNGSKLFSIVNDASGNKLILNPSKNLDRGTTYYIISDSNAVKDIKTVEPDDTACIDIPKGPTCTGTWDGILDTNKIRFSTDPGPVNNGYQPIGNNLNDVGIRLSYDRLATPGPGLMKIYDSANNLVKTISSTDPQVNYFTSTMKGIATNNILPLPGSIDNIVNETGIAFEYDRTVLNSVGYITIKDSIGNIVKQIPSTDPSITFIQQS